MIDEEKYMDVRNKLLQLPRMKASEDFMIKLQHKINLSSEEAPARTEKKSFFRRYVLVPSLSFGTVIVTGVIVWAVFFNNPVNEFSNTKVSPGQQSVQDNINNKTLPDRNFASQTNTNDAKQNASKEDKINQTEQTIVNGNNINKNGTESSPAPLFNFSKPSERVTPKLQVQEENLKEDKTIRNSRIPEAIPPVNNQNYQNGNDFGKSDKNFISEPQRKISTDESPTESRKIRIKDILKDNNSGVAPDSREPGVSNSNESRNPISAPERKTAVTKDNDSPVSKDKTGTVKKDTTSKNKKDPGTKDKKNTTSKPKSKDVSTPKSKQNNTQKPKSDTGNTPKEPKQNN